MGAWNFKKQFAAAVESGEKRQTIRAKRKDGRDPKVGERQALYTGLRTTSSRLLGYGGIIEQWNFYINQDGNVRNIEAFPATLSEIAAADGFEDVSSFIDFFRRTHGLPFDGFLYRWKPV